MQSSNLATELANDRRPGTSAFEEKHNFSVQTGSSGNKRKKKSSNVVRRLYPRSPVHQLKSPAKTSSLSNSAGATSKGFSKKSPPGTAQKSTSPNKQSYSAAKKGAALPSVFSKTKSGHNNLSKSSKKGTNMANTTSKQQYVQSFEPMHIVEGDSVTYYTAHNQSVDGAHFEHEPLDLKINCGFKVNNFFTSVD